MTHFAYTTIDESGRRRTGTVVATSREAATKVLVRGNSVVVKLQMANDWLPALQRRLGFGPDRVPTEELLTFTQQMATMLKAGMNLRKAVEVIANECRNHAMASILIDFTAGLDAGVSLADLFSRHPRVFSPEYVAMVTAGEASGNLPLVLERLVGEIKHNHEMKKRIQSSLYYPLFVCAFALATVVAIVIFGVPRFQSIYDDLGASLPVPTRILLAVSSVGSTYWFPALVILSLAGYAGERYVRTPTGRYRWDSFGLHLPLLGPLLQRIAIARFARTLGVVYAAGLHLPEAMELAAKSTGNAVMERIVMQSTRDVMDGDQIARPLGASGWFTGMAVSMIAAGEQSGTLEVMLREVAAYYEEQVQTTLKGLVSLIEPAVIVLVGTAVGGIILALALPIFQLSSLLQAQ